MKFAMLLSGCGYMDGAEIQESVLCLLAISQHNDTVKAYAPDVDVHSISYIDHKPLEKRNVLEESARIVRGKIAPLEKLNPSDYDGIIIPGGFGVAKHFSDFGEKGHLCRVSPKIVSIIRAFYEQKKVIIATCIAPAILAKIFEGMFSVKLTIGRDKKYLDMLEKMGMKSVSAYPHEVVFDEIHNIYTTAGYMDEADISGYYQSISEVLDRIHEK